jgi:hypothetical protein
LFSLLLFCFFRVQILHYLTFGTVSYIRQRFSHSTLFLTFGSVSFRHCFSHSALFLTFGSVIHHRKATYQRCAFATVTDHIRHRQPLHCRYYLGTDPAMPDVHTTEARVGLTSPSCLLLFLACERR